MGLNDFQRLIALGVVGSGTNDDMVFEPPPGSFTSPHYRLIYCHLVVPSIPHVNPFAGVDVRQSPPTVGSLALPCLGGGLPSVSRVWLKFLCIKGSSWSETTKARVANGFT